MLEVGTGVPNDYKCKVPIQLSWTKKVMGLSGVRLMSVGGSWLQDWMDKSKGTPRTQDI